LQRSRFYRVIISTSLLYNNFTFIEINAFELSPDSHDYYILVVKAGLILLKDKADFGHSIKKIY